MDDPKKGPRLLTSYERWLFMRGSNQQGSYMDSNSITMPCKIQVQHSEFHKQAMR